MTSYLFFVIITLIIEDNSSGWYNMVQRMILKTQERCIYEIEEKELKFYLLIPNTKKVFLTICLMENPTDISIQKILFDQSKVFVIPKIENTFLERIKINSEQAFNDLDKYLSSLINLSHQIIVYNHIEVESVVYFNSLSFPNFETWFIQKYQGRVAATKINYQSEEKPQPVIKEPDTIDNTMTLAASIENSNKIAPPEDIEIEKPEQEEKSHDLGFVSYVLLGVIVAVVSLVFLYLII